MTGKDASKGSRAAAPKRRSKKVESFGSYVHDILRELNTARGTHKKLSEDSVAVLNDFLDGFMRDVAETARRVQLKTGRITTTAKEIEAATIIRMPVSTDPDRSRHMVTHVVSFGRGAVAKFNASR